jgi:hypothetical protein
VFQGPIQSLDARNLEEVGQGEQVLPAFLGYLDGSLTSHDFAGRKLLF